MNRIFSFCLFLFTTLCLDTSACSVYKLTKDGKTMVGNNEDYTSPNGQFWFEPNPDDGYGVMYMGFLNNFAQGAINEAGLMFDGFWVPYLEVKDVEGKLDVPIGDALKEVMETMQSVEEVGAYLSKVNLSILENGQLVFVDRSGTYLIIEGDEMFVGDEPEKIISNFYYSQINSLDEVSIPHFNSGKQFLDSSVPTATLDFCSEAMAHFSQSDFAATQYTTIYDLDELTIRIHLFHDYSDFVEIDLTEELAKGKHRTMIAELFPKESEGYLYFQKYNDPNHPTLHLEEFLGDEPISEQVFFESGFESVINDLGYEWLEQIQNTEGAIKVFQYGLTLMPSSADLHDSLGEAYYNNKEWSKAIASYQQSLALDPENDNAKSMIEEIMLQRKED